MENIRYNFSFKEMSYRIYKVYQICVYKYPNLCCFILGISLLMYGLTHLSFADTPADGSEAAEIIKKQMCKIMVLLEGPFGALICVVAGLAACVTAAMGAYKMAMACVVIACGVFVTESFTRLFFGDSMFSDCSGLPTQNM